MFDFKTRLKKLRSELKAKSIESLLVTNESNVTYLSGFTGSDSVLFITPDSQFFLTDSRYTQEAKKSVRGFAILEVVSSTYDVIGKIACKNGIRKIGFESMNLPYGVIKNLESYIGKAKLLPFNNIVENLRAVKDKEEIARIERSVACAKKVLKNIVGEVAPGVSEKKLSGRIECEFIANGAKSGFKPIVACAENSSKPHAHPTDRKIAKNDIVMIDMGCTLDSYNSDITRMVLTGKIKDKIREIYLVVKAAQEKAFDNIRPGRKISAVDSAGRQHIADKGYGKFFGHSMGHGIGLDVHEEPSVSGRSTGILKPGMVFTVEPAIYVPGLGGIRIEDMVLVTEKGFEILTI
ncbi:MAG: Xaa-Pro peptidase family protein [Candidatus Omnitrophota bacterium]|nr:Xaa-Pro peptidase family protein [Candidatus Omnitrophota bacterium]